jgi:hypothetical protein
MAQLQRLERILDLHGHYRTISAESAAGRGPSKQNAPLAARTRIIPGQIRRRK